MKNPRLWPISRETRSVDITVSEQCIYSISDPLDEETLDTIFNDDFDEDTLQLILVLPLEYTPSISSSVVASDFEAVPERYLWCVIAGRDQVLRIDISNCEIVRDMMDALISESRLGLKYQQFRLWKVRILSRKFKPISEKYPSYPIPMTGLLTV